MLAIQWKSEEPGEITDPGEIKNINSVSVGKLESGEPTEGNENLEKEIPAIDGEELLESNEEENDIEVDKNDPEELEKLFDQFQMEEDDSHTFQHIVNHYYSKGKLILKVNYLTSDEQLTTIKVPFGILCKDVPLELARFVR